MSRNVTGLIQKHLPEEALALVRQAGEMAAARRVEIYLVGGVVRDILLGRASTDLDLVVEGDAIGLAETLAQQTGGKLVVHRRFGTAKVSTGGLTIDLAMARTETYARPGALPRVRPGSINDDLARRDFTINAMAVRLPPRGPTELVDPCGGRRHLREGLICILHERSFSDDASRMLRAVRYEQRFGFRLEDATERLLRRDRAMLDTISGDRLRHELDLVLHEEQPERALRRAGELGLLAQVHPSLKVDQRLEGMFDQARRAAPQLVPAIYYALLTCRFTVEESDDFTARLKTPAVVSRAILDTALLRGRLAELDAPDLTPSGVCALLEEHCAPSALVCAIAEKRKSRKDLLLLYLTEWRNVRPTLDGRALLKLGVPPGPLVGFLLQELRYAKLDGQIKTRKEEVEFVQRWLPRGR